MDFMIMLIKLKIHKSRRVDMHRCTADRQQTTQATTKIYDNQQSIFTQQERAFQ